MSSRHNDILQDDDEFTSLAATSPNDHNYQFYYHQPGSPYDGLGYGALFTLVIVLAEGIPFDFVWTASYLGSLLYLALFASVIGFGSYLTLVQRIGADRAAYASVLFPIVALAVSTVLEGYRWTLPAVIGVALVLVGNLLVLRRRAPAAPPSVSVAAARSGK